MSDLKTLRCKYHIYGTNTGTLPSVPQQNIFLGLPVELMSEEIYLLVIELKVAYVIIDSELHETISSLLSKEDLEYIKTKKQEVWDVQVKQYMETQSIKRKIHVKKDKKTDSTKNENETSSNEVATNIEKKTDKYTLQAAISYVIEPTTEFLPNFNLFQSQYGSAEAKQRRITKWQHPTAESYDIFKYLYSLGCSSSSGLRFGGQFISYPGDPLRYYSHQIVNRYGWDEDIKVLDIVGGARLGTAVKKLWLIGAKRILKGN